MNIDFSGQVYGLIGYPVKHSFSPAIHNTAFKACGINARYRLFEVEPRNLEHFLLNLDKNLAGFNITIPHKIKARQILQARFPFKDTAITPAAAYYQELSGAINTVKVANGELKYYNTDVCGFLRALREDLNFETQGKNVFLIGCGGAGRAVLAGLSWEDAAVNKIYVYDIRREAVSSLKEYFQNLPGEWPDILSRKIEFISPEQIPEVLGDCQLLVNASPAGMRDQDPAVIADDLLHKGLFVYDLVYNKETRLVREASAKGCPAAGGLNMLLYQGAESFKIWTGKEPPLEQMRTALKEELSR